MRETLQEIVDLQREYSHENTPAMQRRGRLIRDQLASQILELRPTLAAALGSYGDDLDAKGRDGTGRKALVPWTRFFSREKSPTPQNGWYVVFLFHPDATGVSLCLSHGSTTFEDGVFHGRGDEEVQQLMDWASRVLGTEFAADPSVRRGIQLGRSDLAAAYERTTVYSKFYPSGAIPGEAQLATDLEAFAAVLARLYRAQDLGRAPRAPTPEVLQILEQIDTYAAPLKPKRAGQGFGLSAAARKAIEMHAMGHARDWLKSEGFTFSDVSATDSCDFRAERNGQKWVIEVKGTTGGPGSILLTRNEVALHRMTHPFNALLVVHGIDLGSDGYSVSGGTLLAMSPWLVEDERLSPLAYEYRLS